MSENNGFDPKTGLPEDINERLKKYKKKLIKRRIYLGRLIYQVMVVMKMMQSMPGIWPSWHFF